MITDRRHATARDALLTVPASQILQPHRCAAAVRVVIEIIQTYGSFGEILIGTVARGTHDATDARTVRSEQSDAGILKCQGFLRFDCELLEHPSIHRWIRFLGSNLLGCAEGGKPR